MTNSQQMEKLFNKNGAAAVRLVDMNPTLDSALRQFMVVGKDPFSKLPIISLKITPSELLIKFHLIKKSGECEIKIKNTAREGSIVSHGETEEFTVGAGWLIFTKEWVYYDTYPSKNGEINENTIIGAYEETYYTLESLETIIRESFKSVTNKPQLGSDGETDNEERGQDSDKRTTIK